MKRDGCTDCWRSLASMKVMKSSFFALVIATAPSESEVGDGGWDNEWYDHTIEEPPLLLNSGISRLVTWQHVCIAPRHKDFEAAE